MTHARASFAASPRSRRENSRPSADIRVAAQDAASSVRSAHYETKVGSAASFGGAANVRDALLSAIIICRRGIN